MLSLQGVGSAIGWRRHSNVDICGSTYRYRSMLCSHTAYKIGYEFILVKNNFTVCEKWSLYSSLCNCMPHFSQLNCFRILWVPENPWGYHHIFFSFPCFHSSCVGHRILWPPKEGLGMGVKARQAEFELYLAHSVCSDGCTVTIQPHFVCPALFYGCFSSGNRSERCKDGELFIKLYCLNLIILLLFLLL